MTVAPLRLTVFLDRQPALRRDRVDQALVLGRGPDADWQIADPRVSRAHLRLEPAPDAPGVWRALDLASKNGVRVNGRMIDRADISQTAWLDLGGVPSLAEISSDAIAMTEAERQSGLKSAGSLTFPQNAEGAADMIRRCAASVVELTASDRGGVWLAREGELQAFCRIGAEAPPVSMSVIEEVMRAGARIIHHDVEGAEALARRHSIRAGAIRAVTGLPLLDGDRPIGVLYADSRRIGACYTELDIDILEGLADHAAIAARLL